MFSKISSAIHLQLAEKTLLMTNYQKSTLFTSSCDIKCISLILSKNSGKFK